MWRLSMVGVEGVGDSNRVASEGLLRSEEAAKEDAERCMRRQLHF